MLWTIFPVFHHQMAVWKLWYFPQGIFLHPSFLLHSMRAILRPCSTIKKMQGIFRIYFPRGNNFTFNLNSFKYQMSHSLPFHSFNFANFFCSEDRESKQIYFNSFMNVSLYGWKKLLKKSTQKYFLTEKWRKNAEFAYVLGSIPAPSDTVESEGLMDAAVYVQYWKFKNKNPLLKRYPTWHASK
jgi:hypothetical protein